MKKIMFLIFIFFLPITTFAKENNYFYSDKEIKELNNCELLIFDNNRYYQEKIVYKDKKETINYKSDIYKYRSDNYILGNEFISLKEQKNEEYVLKEIKEYTYYQEKLKIKYIEISNFNSKYDSYIKQIRIYKNKIEQVKFKIIDNEELSNIINSSNINSNYLLKDKILIELEEESFPNNLHIDLYFGGRYKDTLTYKVNINNNYIEFNNKIELSSTELVKHYFNEINYQEKYNDKILRKEGKYEVIDNSIIVRYDKEYIYQEKLYDYYKIEKEYVDDFIDNNLYKKETNGNIYIYKCPNNINKEIEYKFIDKIKYQNNYIYKEKPVYREKIIYQDKESNSTQNRNYFVKYLIYLGLSCIIYRKR